MNPDVLEKVLQCKQIPSLPAVAVKVLELSGKPNTSFKEIADTITNDAALSSKVLRTVNSSFYALRKPCSSINQAIVMLGLSAVKTLALGFSLVANIAENGNGDFDYKSYWRRSLFTGVGAKCAAAAGKIGHDEEAFLGGLLQDVGMIAMSQALGVEYAAILTECGTDHSQLAKIEHNALETTHADMGALLAGKWKLPPELVMPIKYHHKPTGAPAEYAPLCKTVALGNIIADVIDAPEPAVALKKYYARATEWFAFSEHQADEILKKATEGTQDMARLLAVDAGEVADADAIKSKARDQMLSVQTPEPTESSDTDPVTGLPGRQAFSRNLVMGFEQASNGGPSLSIVLFSIDQHDDVLMDDGEHMADALLAQVCAALRATFEDAGGILCRYTDTTLGAFIPRLDRVGATTLAEQARTLVSAAPINVQPPGLKAQQYHVTLSAGAVCLDATTRDKFTDPGTLIETAERALASAVKGGKNLLRVYVPKNAAA